MCQPHRVMSQFSVRHFVLRSSVIGNKEKKETSQQSSPPSAEIRWHILDGAGESNLTKQQRQFLFHVVAIFLIDFRVR